MREDESERKKDKESERWKFVLFIFILHRHFAINSLLLKLDFINSIINIKIMQYWIKK